MGIPEERLKRVDFASKMDAAMDAKRAAIMKSAATSAEARSPLSSPSNTDSDDSVDVRVRSPAQPKYRKRPRDSAASETRVESDASDGERSARRASEGLVVPKKRFRRDYEAAARLRDEKSDDGESDCGGRERDEDAPVAGCARHRQVVFECAACLEGVAKRFGWPAHALRSPAAPPPVPLPLPVLPPLAMPFAPFVDPLMAFRALGGDPRMAAGLLAGAAPPRPAPVSPPLRRAARPAPPPAAQEEAPLDLTRRTSSSSSSSASGASGGGRFSIENILAGRTAAAEHPAERGLAPRAATAAGLVSPPARVAAKKSSPAPAAAAAAAASRRSALPPHGGERRELANERERMRVKHLTGAFKELSASIGGIASECIGTTGVKFTKVAILRTASLYIGYLSHLLAEGPGTSEEKVYEQMRGAILEVMTSKSKKGKDDEDDEEEV